MKQDAKGIHFHNSLWASAFAGPSGTAMFWWWDQLDRQDVAQAIPGRTYGHYQPLAAFLADVSFAGLEPLNAATGNRRLRLLGYQDNDRAYLWIFDTYAMWWNQVVDKRQPAPITDAGIEIRGLRPGDYSLEWWDTHEGKIVGTEKVSCTQDPLQIKAPSFTGDIACKVR